VAIKGQNAVRLSSLHDFFRGSFSETSTDICIPLKPDMVRRYAFWGSVDIRPTTVKGLKSQHARKKARMGIFQPNWREIKVNAMLAEKIGCGRNLVVEYGQRKSFFVAEGLVDVTDSHERCRKWQISRKRGYLTTTSLLTSAITFCRV